MQTFLTKIPVNDIVIFDTLDIRYISKLEKGLLRFHIVIAALPLALQNAGLDTMTLQTGRDFNTADFNRRMSSTIFLESLVVSSYVPICNIKNSGFFLIIGWLSWLMALTLAVPLILAPEKWETLTLRLFILNRFSSFFILHNLVSNYINSARWPIIIVCFTKIGFVFIIIVRFGNLAIVRIVWAHDNISWV